MRQSLLMSRVFSSHQTLAAILCAAFFIAGCATAGFYPPVNYNIGDEIWAVNASTDFVRDGIGADDIVLPRAYFAALGGFLSITGGGIFAARIFTVLCASFVMYLIYLLGRDTVGGWAGLSSSLVLGSSFGFFWSANVVRPEMMSALFVVLSAWLLLSGINTKNAWKVFLSAFIITASVNVHPNNLQYAIAAIPFYFIIAGRRVLSVMTIYFCVGLLAGFVLWAMIGYMPSKYGKAKGLTAASVAATVPSTVKAKPLSSSVMDAVKGTFSDFTDYAGMFNSFYPNHIDLRLTGAALVLLCIAGLFTRWRMYVVALLGFIVTVDFIGYLITKRMGYWHVIELYPFAALALCIAIFGLKDRLGSGLGRWFVYGVLSLFVITGFADTALTAYDMKGFDYARLIRKVEQKAHGRTLATDLYYPALGRSNYVATWFSLDVPSANCPPVEARVRELGVQYIVADDTMRAFSRLGCGEEYERDLVRYLMLNCDRIAVIDELYPNYWAPGRVIREIYVFRTRP